MVIQLLTVEAKQVNLRVKISLSDGFNGRWSAYFRYGNGSTRSPMHCSGVGHCREEELPMLPSGFVARAYQFAPHTTLG